MEGPPGDRFILNHRIWIENGHPIAVKIRLEPWGEFSMLNANDRVLISALGWNEPLFEVTVDPEGIMIWANGGTTLRVCRADGSDLAGYGPNEWRQPAPGFWVTKAPFDGP